MPNLFGSSALFASNILVCTALYLLRHSSNDSMTRTLYLLAANGVAGLLGFLPFRTENRIKLDSPTIAVIVWSACYCAEYGLFLVYPRVISLSQLIVCNCLAPFFAVYLSRDTQRTNLQGGKKLLSISPVLFLLGISYLERKTSSASSNSHAGLLLLLVLLSVVISQSCARYISRSRSPGWSQPRVTIMNSAFLSLIVSIAIHGANEVPLNSINLVFCLFLGALVLIIQRFYIFGLKRADPFISAMTLCTIVPLSLGTEFLFEHRAVGLMEIALAAGYVLATVLNVKLTAGLAFAPTTEVPSRA